MSVIEELHKMFLMRVEITFPCEQYVSSRVGVHAWLECAITNESQCTRAVHILMLNN